MSFFFFLFIYLWKLISKKSVILKSKKPVVNQADIFSWNKFLWQHEHVSTNMSVMEVISEDTRLPQTSHSLSARQWWSWGMILFNFLKIDTLQLLPHRKSGSMLNYPVELELHSEVPVEISYPILWFILKESFFKKEKKMMEISCTKHGQTAVWFSVSETAWD